MIGVVGDDEDSKKAKTDYACAGERHYEDAAYLHGDGRLLNADHLFGLAVECLMKALLKRFAGAHGVSMRNSGGSESDRLWWDDPHARNQNRKRKTLGHVNEMREALPLLLDGRPGLSLTEALRRVSQDFEKWIVDDRYTDGTHLDRALLSRRQEAAKLAHELHLHVEMTGKLP
ncbi:hypothetical protein GCM10010246_37420 [Streptomyces cuspidosporus]|uniref:Uncharacterized protein n=1 Tax=Streptomyces cuspidosporus TaxID=66882 RepID=A0ABN3G9Y3_9ACTN